RMKDAERLFAVAFAIPSPLAVQEFNRREWPMFLRARGRLDEARAAAGVLIEHPSPLVRAVGHIEAGHALAAGSRVAAAAAESNAALGELKRVTDGAAMIAGPLQALQGEFWLRSGQREKGRAALDEAIQNARAARGPDAWIQALLTLE